MFSKNHIINIISSALVISIGGLFILKYSSRFTELYLLLAIFYVLTATYLLQRINRKVSPFRLVQKNISALLLWLILFVAFCLLYLIIPTETRVGRHSAINEWLQTLLNGSYPYGISSNPSGMPILFFLALPFYLASDAGFLVSAGTALTIAMLYESGKYKRSFFLSFTLLFITPVFYYEYLVRSELMTNMVLTIAAITLTKRFISSGKQWSNIAVSFLWGLLLSTRLPVVLIYVLVLLFYYRSNLRKMIFTATLSLIFFAATLLPFYIANPEVFLQKGPFAIQMLYIPISIVPIFAVLTLYTGWMIADEQELYFSTGLLLFALVMISFVSSILSNGFYQSIFNDRFDISYFILPVPFFIFSIKEYTVDRYLGKVYND